MYRIVVNLLKALTFWWIKIDVKGEENLPQTGPAILCFNHVDLLDSVIMVFAINRDVWGIAGSNYKYNPLIFLFWLLKHVILIHRGEIDRDALKAAQKVLEAGKFLGIAPEGTRNQKGILQHGKPGMVFLTKSSNPIIVPVGIIGSKGAFSNLLKGIIHVQVVIGNPFKLNMNVSACEGMKSSEKYDYIINTQVMPKIAALLPDWMRGEFA